MHWKGFSLILVIFCVVRVNPAENKTSDEDFEFLKKCTLNIAQNWDCPQYEEFFNRFPVNFELFLRFYSYQKDTSLTMYYQAFEHFKILNECKFCVADSQYISKFINLGVNGRWDADAVSLLQNMIINNFVLNQELSCQALTKLDDEEITNFFVFYMDKFRFNLVELPTRLASLESKYPKLHDCALDALNRLKIRYKIH